MHSLYSKHFLEEDSINLKILLTLSHCITTSICVSTCLIHCDIPHFFNTPHLFVPLQTLMLVSSTTRPLLGCIWSFPTVSSGLIFATTSMVIHEAIPMFLMTGTNLGSLLVLYAHGNAHKAASKNHDGPVLRRVPAEKRAAKVRHFNTE